MPFPTVESRTHTQGTNSTNWSMTGIVPAHNSGEVLFLVFGTDGGPTITPAAVNGVAWTSLAQTGTTARLGIFWLRATSNQATDLTITAGMSTTEQGVARCWRVMGAHATTAPATVTPSTATTSTPNPAIFNPTAWDIEDTLWFALVASDGAATATAFPSNMDTSTGFTDVSGGGQGGGLHTCRVNSATASFDPGTFTLSSSVAVVTATAAIRPAPYVPQNYDETGREVSITATVNGTDEKPGEVTVRSVASFGQGSGTTINVPNPAGTIEGDIVVVVLTHGTGTAVTLDAPDGSWTNIGGVVLNGSLSNHTTFWKLAGPSEPSTWAFTSNTSNDMVAAVATVKNPNPTTPVNVSHTLNQATNNIDLSVTTTVPNCLLLAIVTSDYAADTTHSSTTMTEHLDEAFTAFSNISHAIYSEPAPTATTYNRQIVASSSLGKYGAMLAIAPAATGPQNYDENRSITIAATVAETDTYNTTEAQSLTIAGTVTPTDNRVLTEATSVQADAILSRYEVQGHSEQTALTSTATVTITDETTGSLFDDVSVSIAATVTLADTATVSDSQQVSITSTVAITDARILTDNTQVSVTATVAITDTQTATEARQVTSTATVTSTDSGGPVENVTVSGNVTTSVVEIASINENVSLTATATTVASEQASSTENVQLSGIVSTVATTTQLHTEPTQLSINSTITVADGNFLFDNVQLSIVGTISATDVKGAYDENVSISGVATTTQTNIAAFTNTTSVDGLATISIADLATFTLATQLNILATIDIVDLHQPLITAEPGPGKTIKVVGAGKNSAGTGSYNSLDVSAKNIIRVFSRRKG